LFAVINFNASSSVSKGSVETILYLLVSRNSEARLRVSYQAASISRRLEYACLAPAPKEDA